MVSFGRRFIVPAMAMLSAAASAQTQWAVNGHYYQLITTQRTWQQAKIDAEGRVFAGMQGHLMTITSQGEQDFVNTTFGEPLREAYIGGQKIGSQWTWITGEPFEYTNWAPGEPPGDGGVL